jgi:hypothetical protein
MPELSATLIFLTPLVLLVIIALWLIRLGLTSKELTEAARQRIAGLGMMVLHLVIFGCVATSVIGFLAVSGVLKLH